MTNRRWYQYSLRTLMAVVLVVSVAMSSVVVRARKLREIEEEIHQAQNVLRTEKMELSEIQAEADRLQAQIAAMNRHLEWLEGGKKGPDPSALRPGRNGLMRSKF